MVFPGENENLSLLSPPTECRVMILYLVVEVAMAPIPSCSPINTRRAVRAAVPRVGPARCW
jgi:hypothetical protein